MQSIHVASGQMVCVVGDVRENLDRIAALTAEAADCGARLILFGEGAVTGYLLTENILKKALTEDGPEADRLRRLSRGHDIVIAAGTIERSVAGLHMSHFVVFPDGRIHLQRKHRLTPKELAANLIPGPEERALFEVDGVKFSLSICADSGIPDLWNRLARQGCQVYLGPSAGGGGRPHMCHEADLEDEKRRSAYLEDMEKVCFVGHGIRDCITHRMALVCVNLAGDDGVDNYHPGHSFIIDSHGKLVDFVPGEYVVEFLRPRLVHGEIAVQPPREAVLPPTAPA